MSDSGAPNPFSREGSSPQDALGPRQPPAAGPDRSESGPLPASPVTPPRVPEWPTYRGTDEPVSPAPSPPGPTTAPGAPSWSTAPAQNYAPVPDPGPYAPTEIPPYGPPQRDPHPATPDPFDPTAVNPYAPSPFAAPYGPTPYGLSSPYGVAPQHPQAVTALVLGIVGLVVCPPVGVAGIVLGQRVRRDSDTRPGQFSGRGLGTAALVLGIVSLVAFVFWVVLFVGLIASDY